MKAEAGSNTETGGFVRRYIAELSSVIAAIDPQQVAAAAEALREVHRRRGRVYVMGNGGSAATATHLAADLGKNAVQDGRPRFQVIGLCDNQASITAYANDCGYETVFEGQLATLLEPPDAAVAISASGNSPNVVRAVELARSRGASTIGVTGFDGGRLGRLVDVHVNVALGTIEQVEDAHLVVTHMIVSLFKYGVLGL
jgi:D-sedoheptulose 7-phosphate isomerase